MKDGALADRAFTTKQWQTKQDINLFEGWLGNRPDLNPIKSLWSQIKQLQNKEHATLAAGLKRIAFSSPEEDLANLHQISLQKHAEAYDRGC